MSVQARQNNSNLPFILSGDSFVREAETIEQDAARATALAPFTVMAQTAANEKWVPLTSVDPTLTPGIMRTGAMGTDAGGFAAVTDGSFGLSVDGVAIALTGLDFSDVVSELDTNATAVGGANGANLAAWQAITDGSLAVTVDGVALTLTGLDFSAITDLANIADVINDAAAGDFFTTYDSAGDIFSYFSQSAGATSTLSAMATGGVGTDISAAGFLNTVTGTVTLTQGTGSDSWKQGIQDVINSAAAGRFFVVLDPDGDDMLFSSPTVGLQSTVSVLIAGVGGTDISGAGFLNGLTGTGTATAGTGNDGTNIPTGIYLGGSITAAELVAADVEDRPILIGGCCTVDENQMVLENSLALSDVVVANQLTIRAQLGMIGIYPEDTIYSTNLEN